MDLFLPALGRLLFYFRARVSRRRRKRLFADATRARTCRALYARAPSPRKSTPRAKMPAGQIAPSLLSLSFALSVSSSLFRSLWFFFRPSLFLCIAKVKTVGERFTRGWIYRLLKNDVEVLFVSLFPAKRKIIRALLINKRGLMHWSLIDVVRNNIYILR